MKKQYQPSVGIRLLYSLLLSLLGFLTPCLTWAGVDVSNAPVADCPTSITANASSATVTPGSVLTLTASGGATYQWSTGQTGSSIPVSPSATTTYSVTGIPSVGCSNTAVVTVTVSGSAPTVNLPLYVIDNPSTEYAFSGYPIGYRNQVYGRFYKSSGEYLMGRYNGFSWQIISNPDNATANQGYSGAAVVANDVLYGLYLNQNNVYQVFQYTTGSTSSLIANPDNSTVGFSNQLAVLGNTLYGVYTTNQGVGQLVRLDGSTWTLIANPDNGNLQSLRVFNNTLYATYINQSGQSKWIRYNGSDWTSFDFPSVGYNPPSQGIGYTEFIEYKGLLYAQVFDAGQTPALARFDGTTWTIVSGSAANAPFGNFAVFDGYLYMASIRNGVLIQLRFDGTDFLPIYSPGYSGQPIVFTNALYGSYSDGSTFLLGQFDGTILRLVANPPNTTVGYLAFHNVINGQLYGLYRQDSGNPNQLITTRPPVCQTLVHVTEAGAGLQDGSSWANAYPGTALQTAIDGVAACGGGQVWVAAGVYKPTRGTDRTASFTMRNNVAIYGGFVGSETALSGRPAVNPVTGPGGVAQPSSSTLSGEISNPNSLTDNSQHVIYNPTSLSLNTSALLNGFVLSNGYTQTGYGGAILNESGNNPTIQQCLFQNNYASNGGAFYNRGNSPIITDCVFQRNTATTYGGGFFMQENNIINLINCVFNQNSSGGGGGGICNFEGSLTLTNCSFLRNTADYGGGVYTNEGFLTVTGSSFVSNSAVSSSGGGLGSDGSEVTFERCTIQDNFAQSDGGGVMLDDPTTLVTLRNCSFKGNRSLADGGGIAITTNVTIPILVTNSSFITNKSDGLGGAISTSRRNSLTVVNGSFQGNEAGNDNAVSWGAVTDAENAYLINCVEFGNTVGEAFFDSFRAEYSLLASTSYTDLLLSSTNNLTATVTPFASTTGTQLAPCSPAINAGNPATTSATVGTTDLAGNSRFFNNAGTPVARIDMGAYEFQGAGLPISYSVLGSGTATCASSPTITLSNSETGVSYQLQRNGTNVGSTTAGTGSALSFGPQSLSGTYTVLATSTSGCTAVMATSATVVSNTTSPALSLSPSSATLTCGSPTVTLTATAGLTSYSFSTGQTGSSNTLVVSSSNVYSVTATGPNGCTALASTTITSSTAVPTVSIQASSTVLSCSSPTVSLSAIGVGSVLWSTGVSTSVISASAATTYSVTLTNANGCSAVGSITIGGSTSAASLSVTPGSATLTCSSPTVLLTAIGGGGVRWSTGASTPVISVSVANTYSVTLTGSNGCTAVASAVVVSSTAAPSLSINASTTVISCANPTVSLSAIGTGSVLWSTGASTSVISATAAGTYSVVLTNSSGCTATTSVMVSSSLLGNVSVSADGPLGCGVVTTTVRVQAVGATSFTLVGPNGYNQSNPTGVFTVVAGGSYTALAGQSGCVVSGTVMVVEGGVQPTISSVAASGSLGASSCTVSVSAAGLGDRYVLTGPSGYVFSVVYRTAAERVVSFPSVVKPGAYTLTVYSGNCVVSRSLTVSGTACP